MGVRGRPRASSGDEHRYELLTWPEINEAVAQEKVVVLPIGSVEQHGHHLPARRRREARHLGLLTRRACGRPRRCSCCRPVSYGYTHHVMDFPGTINVSPITFVNMLIDIGDVGRLSRLHGGS